MGSSWNKKFSLQKIEKNTALIIGLILCILLWAAIFNPSRFYRSANFISMAYQIPEFGILSLGMALCMISGGIDLSLVGTANLCCVVAALQMTGGGTALTAVLLSLATGAAAGMFNGILIGVLEIPPMLVTLGGLQIYTGLATVITKGVSITGIPESFLAIGHGLLFNKIPYSLVILVAVAAILSLALKYTVYGSQIYMVGTNKVASVYAGINNAAINICTYMISGIFAGICGIIMCSRYGSANADYGSSYTLLTLLIAVLGGIRPDGGKGKVFGVMLSIIILQLISSIFNILRFSAFLKTCIWGLVLIVVMIINCWLTNHPIFRKKT